MDIFKAAERMMAMDDASWARHANPLSVWSRISCLPLLVLAIWSRVWLGWWCLVPLALAVAWTWYNPRAFGPPPSTDNWASQGVMGERIFLSRAARPIPAHHLTAAHALTGVSAFGAAILIYGLIVLDAWATLCGVAVTVLGKIWFVDRMVWLYADMRSAKQP